MICSLRLLLSRVELSVQMKKSMQDYINELLKYPIPEDSEADRRFNEYLSPFDLQTIRDITTSFVDPLRESIYPNDEKYAGLIPVLNGFPHGILALMDTEKQNLAEGSPGSGQSQHMITSFA